MTFNLMDRRYAGQQNFHKLLARQATRLQNPASIGLTK